MVFLTRTGFQSSPEKSQINGLRTGLSQQFVIHYTSIRPATPRVGLPSDIMLERTRGGQIAEISIALDVDP